MKYYYHRIKLFLLYILGPPYIKNTKKYIKHISIFNAKQEDELAIGFP